ncbi:unnamed protein product [Zymoseptoria tritici ST99CH_3D1]|uniref:Uncharacterized protein n=1 Tax=Zymoseptoria tritici (strain ST99CH_3D7) TaxID=1276538 RepID=A0A1X7RV55_ZYMT9|nr:unnamed protein product [Zymoseptoria tritici ST99CH_3D7]SMR54921.1 unnamed protein product [Zymoseptoria tritici ST99CH_3D1]
MTFTISSKETVDGTVEAAVNYEVSGVLLSFTLAEVNDTIEQAISDAANEWQRQGNAPPQELTDLHEHVEALQCIWEDRVRDTQDLESSKINDLNDTIRENELDLKRLRRQLKEREDDLVAARAQRASVDEFNTILSHLRPAVTKFETTVDGAQTATDHLKKLGDSTHRIKQHLDTACTQFVDSSKDACSRMSALVNDATFFKSTVDSATIDMASLGQGVESLKIKCEGVKDQTISLFGKLQENASSAFSEYTNAAAAIRQSASGFTTTCDTATRDLKILSTDSSQLSREMHTAKSEVSVLPNLAKRTTTAMTQCSNTMETFVRPHEPFDFQTPFPSTQVRTPSLSAGLSAKRSFRTPSSTPSDDNSFSPVPGSLADRSMGGSQSSLGAANGAKRKAVDHEIIELDSDPETKKKIKPARPEVARIEPFLQEVFAQDGAEKILFKDFSPNLTVHVKDAIHNLHNAKAQSAGWPFFLKAGKARNNFCLVSRCRSEKSEWDNYKEGVPTQACPSCVKAKRVCVLSTSYPKGSGHTSFMMLLPLAEQDRQEGSTVKELGFYVKTSV